LTRDDIEETGSASGTFTSKLTAGAHDAAVWLGAPAGARPGEGWTEMLNERIRQSGQAVGAVRARIDSLDGARDLLEQISRRWSATGNGQFAGRLHEFHHATTFNMSAAERGATIRAHVTEWNGLFPDPHDPADLRIVSAAGNPLTDIQAKAVANTAQRIHQLASERYAGMQLVVPTDHVGPTADLLERRMAQGDPEFLKHAAYASVEDRLTDRIEMGAVSSEPVTSETLREAARDPNAYFRNLQNREQDVLQGHVAELSTAAHQIPLAEIMQVVGAAGAGALSGFTASVMINGVANAARAASGRMSPAEAALTTVTASTDSLVQGALVGGLGQTIRLTAEHGVLPDVLGGGALPFVAARAAIKLGDISVKYARGQIDGADAAAQSADSLLRVGYGYAGMLVGQALIPVPVVGALIGGTVGSLCAGITVQGLVVAHSALKQHDVDRRALTRLEVEIDAAVIVLDAETHWLREAIKGEDVAFRNTILPALEGLEQAIQSGNFVDSVPRAAAVVEIYGKTPLFTTYAEFDRWISDETTSLELNPNSPRATVSRFPELRPDR
jgi:hypothetical protein